MLIDVSYFMNPPRRVKSLTLGNGTPLIDPNARRVFEFVRSYIDRYVPEYLERMFGRGSRVQRYIMEKDDKADLVDGFLERLTAILKEPCADYFYYCMLRDTVSDTTIDGEVRAKINDSYVSPIRKQVTAWNSMARGNLEALRWLEGQREGSGIEVSSTMLKFINYFNL